MRETIALAVLLLFASSTLVLAAKKRIGVGIAAVFLCFALIAGWIVSHHDWLSTMGIGGTSGSGGDHPDGSPKATGTQGLPAGQPTPTLRDIVATLESQQKALEALGESTGKVREKLNTGDQQLKELQESLEQVKREAEALRTRSSDLALMITRIIWLQMEAMDDTDVDRADAAVGKILDEMDEIMKLAIEDPVARSRFVDDIKKALPPRR
jgi:hypothetical protein